MLDHCRHPSDDRILPVVPEQRLQRGLGEGHFVRDVPAYLGCLLLREAQCPQILFEIHRIHPYDGFVPHRRHAPLALLETGIHFFRRIDIVLEIVFFANVLPSGAFNPGSLPVYPFILRSLQPCDTEERAAGYDVAPAIVHQRLDCRPRIVAHLNLIKEQQRPPSHGTELRIPVPQLFEDAVSRQVPLEYLLGIWVRGEVEGKEAVVLILPEFVDDVRLPYLSGTGNDHSLLAWIRLPFEKRVHHLALHKDV